MSFVSVCQVAFLTILASASDIPPTWSDEFNGSGAPDPTYWTHEQGFVRNNELQWYQPGNAWQEDGMLIIEGRREQVANPNYNPQSSDWKTQRQFAEYTSSSIRTKNKYSFQYGRMQVRAKIPALPGMWPAIWTVGDNGEWPSNGECDIMEYYGGKILANCARGTTTRWNAAWDASNKTMTSLNALDENWANRFHVWTMQWDQNNVRLYVDNILMNTTPQGWLVNPVTTWGPLEPFKQPHNIFLNLAIGGNAGGNPSGTPMPQRFLVDYVRVWENYTSNSAPTDIALTSSTVVEGQPGGTLVGNLTAIDSDPAEVISYSLVGGAGSTDNASFTIGYLSDETRIASLRTTAPLSISNGSTRSIRVRATDIVGATFDKILTIHVVGDSIIEVSPSSVSVPEGGTNTFDVRLRTLPDTNITVNVSRQSGDEDISVLSGASLVFTPSNGTDWQTVTLAAAEDDDRINGTAIILCSDASGTFASATVIATEAENDNGVPLVNAGPNRIVFLTGSAPWTPAEMTTAAWYDASDTATITASSGTVSQWADKSGSGNHLSAGGDPKTGTRSINGLNAIDFSSDHFAMTSDINMLGKAAFLVVEADSIGANRILMGRSTQNVQLRIDAAGSIRYAAQSAYYPNSPFTNATITAGAPAVLGYLLNTTMQFSVNGAFENSGQIGGGSGMTTYNWIGRRDSGVFFDGTMGEIVITPSLPDTETRQKIEGYLAHKWGTQIRMPGGHPYKNSAPSLASISVALGGTVSDPEDDPLATTWSWVSGPTGVNFADASAVHTTVSFTLPGTYVLRLTASDGTDSAFHDITITVGGSSSASQYAIWAAANNLIGPAADPMADADNNGLTNFQKYAFGMNPNASFTGPIEFTEGGAVTRAGMPFAASSPHFRAVFGRRKDFEAAGLFYTVEFSSDLHQWVPSSDIPTVLTGENPNAIEAVSVPYPDLVPANGGFEKPSFFRVGVGL